MNNKILCIEDERFISDLYTRALNRAGYEVETAIDGEDGLNKALTNEYGIILLDIMLPSMNGVEILQKIKAPDSSSANIKVIITTNLDQGDDVRKKVEEMADGYLIKAEITPKELVKFVDQIAKPKQ